MSTWSHSTERGGERDEEGGAIGAAALLTQIFISADVAFPLSSLGLRLFCIVNAAACLWIARISLDEKARS